MITILWIFIVLLNGEVAWNRGYNYGYKKAKDIYDCKGAQNDNQPE